jgi:hypothetical protein
VETLQAGTRAARASGKVSYQSLYQALPLALVGRTFASLRLELFPGVVKYRDAIGQLTEAGTKALGDLQSALPSSDAVDAFHMSLPQALRPRTELTPSQQGVGSPTSSPRQAETGSRISASLPRIWTSSLPEGADHGPRAVDSATAVLLEVLFAPLAPQERHCLIRELTAGWRLRLPLTMEAFAVDTDAARLAIVSLAQRCAGVFLADRRMSSMDS